MALTEARRRANNKYIAKNYTVVGCKVRKDEAEKFKEACKEAGTTPNAIFRAAMDDFMGWERQAREEQAALDVMNIPDETTGQMEISDPDTNDESFAEEVTYEQAEDAP